MKADEFINHVEKELVAVEQYPSVEFEWKIRGRKFAIEHHTLAGGLKVWLQELLKKIDHED